MDETHGMADVDSMFDRTQLLVGTLNMKNIQATSVMVAGVGGVGAFAVEALVRAGIGKIILFDGDIVSRSNLNRQLIALNSTIGKSKAELMYSRLKDINPNCEIIALKEYIRDDRMEEVLDKYHPDWVIDAIDTLSPKVFLLMNCYKRNIHTVSCMGSGGKYNPSAIQITDISQTYNCPLASQVRKRLHKMGVYEGISAVFSAEKVDASCIREEKSDNKITTIGTISYMPAMFGLMAASVVLRSIMNIECYKKQKDTKYYQDKKEFKL